MHLHLHNNNNNVYSSAVSREIKEFQKWQESDKIILININIFTIISNP